MAGSMTIGGMADGLLIGQVTIGPSTVNGKAAISEVFTIELTANVDTVIAVPKEGVAWAIVFPVTTSEPTAEVKIRTNLNNTDAGLPVPAVGFVAGALTSATTELKLKSTAPPAAFQLVFI